MTAAEMWLQATVPVLLTLLLARALWALIAVEVCARWLLARAGSTPTGTQAGKDAVPWLVVLLPMLREQTIAEETVTAFRALDYPRDRAAVVVITTEREVSARAGHRDRLAALAAHAPLEAGQLRGLFPTVRCRKVAETVNAERSADRLRVLSELFDAEPTTADIVTSSPPACRTEGCRWCISTSPMSADARPDSSTSPSTAWSGFSARSGGGGRAR
ncbi:hypothetical protein ACFQ60_03190 [Streptomyces zhihengii]